MKGKIVFGLKRDQKINIFFITLLNIYHQILKFETKSLLHSKLCFQSYTMFMFMVFFIYYFNFSIDINYDNMSSYLKSKHEIQLSLLIFYDFPWAKRRVEVCLRNDILNITLVKKETKVMTRTIKPFITN